MKTSELWLGITGVLAVLFAIAGLIAFVHYYYSIPHDQTIKIWTPAKYHIDNPVGESDQYLPIDEVRVGGTAMYLSFEEYQQYQNRKNPKDNAVMIQKDGTVFYETREVDKNYVTKKRYGIAPFMDAKVTKITGDTMDISQEITAKADTLFIGSLLLDLFASAIVSGIIVVIVTIIGYLRKVSGRKAAA